MSEKPDNNQLQIDRITNLIGIFACDIRQGWGSYVYQRLECIVRLSKMIGRTDWVEEIKANTENILNDGRWLRSAEWSGPFSWEKCTRENVGDDLYNEYIDDICFLKSSSDESDNSEESF